ncbi:MAG: Gfo/Idh/MocA family oxidoreductase [Lachnospiraceae bacterium]|nr:Gfo/Idh/MocA family oxidoreductase [Lachnospiraceae bacterium]
MKIVIFGLGSMGKRRMRLLHEIAIKENRDIELFGIDGREDRRNEAEDQAAENGFAIKTAASLDELMSVTADIDAAVISTSPLSHANIINDCLKRGLHVFTELNLVKDRYEENMTLAVEKGVKLFLSSTPIYRDEMRYITDKVKNGPDYGKINYTFHVGQYLPDWHPWESYKDFFIGSKRTNGCREILAVELPWIARAFGSIESVQVQTMRQTGLDIDFNDCYNVLIRHSDGNMGVFTVDVTARIAICDLKVIGENTYITWDGTPEGLVVYDPATKEKKVPDLYENVEHREGYSHVIVENMYVNELKAFLDYIENGTEPVYGFEQDAEILDLIDEIEGIGYRYDHDV